MSGQRFDARLMQPPFQSVVGTKVTAAAAAGATTLLVEMAGDFDDAPAQGVAHLRIRPTQQPDADPVAPFVVAYSTWDGELDEQEYIVLTAGLPVAVPAESLVDVWSPAATAPLDVTLGEPVTVYEALVMPDDEDVNAEPLTVTVHPDLMDTMGALDGLTEDTPVLVETQQSYDPYGEDDGDDELFLTRVLGGSLVRDGEFIDPETLPIPELPEGVVLEPTSPPASSPTPEVLPFPGGAVYVRFTPVDDALFYRLHVSTSNQSALSSLTLVSDVATPPVVVRTLANGSPFPSDPNNTDQPLVYVSIVASNGPGLDATKSAWVGGRPGQVDPAFLQLLAGTIIAERLFGETVEGVNLIGSTVTGAIVRTAASGPRWQLGQSNESNRILAYTGAPGEFYPGQIRNEVGSGIYTMLMKSPQMGASSNIPAGLDLITRYNSSTAAHSTDALLRATSIAIGSPPTSGASIGLQNGAVSVTAPNGLQLLTTITDGNAGTGSFFTNLRDRIITASRADSGWLSLPLASGFSNPTNPARTSRYRLINGIVYVEVSVAGSIGTTNTTVGTIPSGYRPTSDMGPIPASAGAPGGGVVHAFVLASGVVQLRGAAAVTQGYMQITYPL